MHSGWRGPSSGPHHMSVSTPLMYQSTPVLYATSCVVLSAAMRSFFACPSGARLAACPPAAQAIVHWLVGAWVRPWPRSCRPLIVVEREMPPPVALTMLAAAHHSVSSCALRRAGRRAASLPLLGPWWLGPAHPVPCLVPGRCCPASYWPLPAPRPTRSSHVCNRSRQSALFTH